MDKFLGDEGGFRGLIELAGLDGTWSQQPNCIRFRSREGGGVNWAPTTGKVWYDGGAEAKGALKTAVAEAAVLQAGGSRPVSNDKKTIFVVHGHDTQSREQLELVLMKLGLTPFVLQNADGGGMTIIEQLEAKIGRNASSAFGIVLLTPDDMGYAKKDGATEVKARARQNVILEMGMLLASLTRTRVAMLQKGHVEHPSDVSGIIYIPFNDHVKEAVPKLVQRLNAAGFDIDAAAVAHASA